MSFTPADVWQTLKAVRDQGPLVHNITNYVAMQISANALLAVGASPAMIHAVEEASDFAGIASALVVNIGTLSPRWVEAMEASMQTARAKGTPVVLDPVGVGATPYRTDVAVKLLRLGPTVVRGNASEIMALAGAAGITAEAASGKGVDSTHSSAQALGAATAMARTLGLVVAVSGEVDVITDGERVAQVHNGHVLFTRVTAMGCSLSGVLGAFLAVESDALKAVTSAFAVYGLAGEIAAQKGQGPGTFKAHLLDSLYTLDEEATLHGVKLQ
ncbi:MAG: hydroxyethylthiazole kinase [Bradymonadia bacterium]